MTDFNRERKSDRYKDVMPAYKSRKQASIKEIFMDRGNEGRLTQKISRGEFRVLAEQSLVEKIGDFVDGHTAELAALKSTYSFVGILTQTSTNAPTLKSIKVGYPTELGTITASRNQTGWFDFEFPFKVSLTDTAISISGLQHGSAKEASTYTLEAIDDYTIRVKTATNVGGSIVSEDNIFKNSMIIVESTIIP